MLKDNDSVEYLISALKSMFEHTSDFVFIKDKNLKYIASSKAFAKLVNYEKGEDLYHKTDFDIFDKELATKYSEDDKKLLRIGRPIINYLESLPEKDGTKRYASTSKFLLMDKDGDVFGLYGISRDITEQIELEEVRENREVSEGTFEAILEADLTNNTMLRVEGADWVQALCLDKERVFSKNVALFASKFIDKDYAEEFKQLYEAEKLLSDYKNGKKTFCHISIHVIDGQNPRYLEFKTRVYYSKITETIKATAFVRDIDAELKATQDLKMKAVTDHLTGLLNREGIESKVKKALNQENGKQNNALLFMDLDRFKQLNDAYGHLFGDKVLKETAKKLVESNMGKNIIGRYGGDEFVIFIENYSSIEALEAEVRTIMDAVQDNKYGEDGEICITCSLGIALYDGKKTLQTLYDEADKAMYFSKVTGSKRYSFFKS